MDPWGQVLPASPKANAAQADRPNPWSGDGGSSRTPPLRSASPDSRELTGNPAEQVQSKIRKLRDLGLQWVLPARPARPGDDKLHLVDHNPKPYVPVRHESAPDGFQQGPTPWLAEQYVDAWGMGESKMAGHLSPEAEHAQPHRQPRDAQKTGSSRSKKTSTPPAPMADPADWFQESTGPGSQRQQESAARPRVTFEDEVTGRPSTTVEFAPSDDSTDQMNADGIGQPLPDAADQPPADEAMPPSFSQSGNSSSQQGGPAPANQAPAGAPIGFGNSPPVSGRPKKSGRRWKFGLCCGSQGRGGHSQPLSDDDD